MAQDLLVLDNSLDPGFYRPVEHWSHAAGFSPDSIHLPSGGHLPDPGRHRHVILTGSEDSIIALPGWARAEARWLREAVSRGARVLGSCWGHQLIAAALGGPGCVRRAAAPEFGWLRVEVTEDTPLLPRGEFYAFSSHFDEVVAGSHPELRVQGFTPGCAVHLLRWGGLPVWGIQSHPEIDPEDGRHFLETAAERWPDAADALRAALAGPMRDSGCVQELVKRFLET